MHNLLIFTYSTLLTIGIIAGIGPQTLNIINHSVSNNYAKLVTFTSIGADMFLILLGCYGIGTINNVTILKAIYICGIVFMSYYTIVKLINLTKYRNLTIINRQVSQNKAIINALAMTLLNPLVFVDTIVVIGGNSSLYDGNEHIAFTLGALSGDFIWLFGVMYCANKFSAYLNKKSIWLIIDIITIILVLVVIIKMFGFLI